MNDAKFFLNVMNEQQNKRDWRNFLLSDQVSLVYPMDRENIMIYFLDGSKARVNDSAKGIDFIYS